MLVQGRPIRARRACALQGPRSTAARRLGAVADGREHGKRRAGPRACDVPRSIGALLPRLYSNKRDTAAGAVTVTISTALAACTHGAPGEPGHGREGEDWQNAPRPGPPSKFRAACVGGRVSSPPAPPWRACTATGRSSCPVAPQHRHSTHRTPSLRAAPGPPPRVTTHQARRMESSLPRLTFHEGLRPAAPLAHPRCIFVRAFGRGKMVFREYPWYGPAKNMMSRTDSDTFRLAGSS
jgi:hypothetical protein